MTLKASRKRTIRSVTISACVVFTVTWIAHYVISTVSLGMTTQIVTPPLPQKRQLLLITYGRTGSTFTSAIISHDTSVFYVSEPLHGMPADIYNANITLTTQQMSFDTIDAFLDCNFRKIDPGLFRDQLFRSSVFTGDLYECLKNEKLDGYAYLRCFLSMWESCLRHSVSFIKMLRFRSEWAEAYLRRFPSLKILFLVRDIRAVLYSQSRMFRTFQIQSNATERVSQFCDQVKKDIQTFFKLKSIFPGRVMGIRYEDGCLDSVKFTRKIYKFMDLRFDENVLSFVNQITKSNRSGKAVSNSYGVERRDSVKAMNRWRKSADFRTVKNIDNICKDVYSVVGYTAITSEKELFSENNLLVTTPNYSGLFND